MDAGKFSVAREEGGQGVWCAWYCRRLVGPIFETIVDSECIPGHHNPVHFSVGTV